MKFYRQRFTLFQMVATPQGIGKIYAINHDSKICDVYGADWHGTYSFSDLVKA